MIDFHTHIFPDHVAERSLPHLASVCKTMPYTNGKTNGLLRSTKEAGLLCSVVLPVVTTSKQFDSIHRFAIQFLEGDLISFGGIHPEQDDYKERLRWIKKQGLKGIKLHPDYQGTYFNDIRYKRILSYATELDLIIVTHAGADPLCPNDVHCTPQMAAEVIAEVKPEKLILAHMGGNQMAEEVERHLIGKPVYFDTAYVMDKLEKEQFVRMVRNHGADNVLFASDSPWGGQKEYVAYFQNLLFSETEKRQIGYENAKRLLNL